MTDQANRYCPPADPIVMEPKKVYRDFYHQQVVQVVQPVEIINRHHCVPVYQQCYSYSERDEICTDRSNQPNPYRK
jgi:hypothetical protein